MKNMLKYTYTLKEFDNVRKSEKKRKEVYVGPLSTLRPKCSG